MDPTACLMRLCNALDEQWDSEAVQAASDLLCWLLNGGERPLIKTTHYLALKMAQLADRQAMAE